MLSHSCFRFVQKSKWFQNHRVAFNSGMTGHVVEKRTLSWGAGNGNGWRQRLGAEERKEVKLENRCELRDRLIAGTIRASCPVC